MTIRPRSIGRRSRHAGSAASAALTAASMSRASPRAISPSGFPVAGFVVSRWRPLAAGTKAPPMKCSYRSCIAPLLSDAAGQPGALHDCLEDAHRGGVDEDAARSRRAGAASRGGLVGLAHPPGERDLLLGRRIDVVGDLDLARMDGPLADEAEGRRPGGLATVAVRITVVGEGPVDRVDAGRPRRDHDPRPGIVPKVAGVPGRERQAHTLARRQVTEAEDERLEPWRRGR